MTTIILPLAQSGAAKDAASSLPQLGIKSFNLYQAGGYLRQYEGKQDIWRRPVTPDPKDPNPPPVGVITRLFVYADRTGYEHVVFVLGDSVCVKYGNGYRTVGKLEGINYDGLYYPTIFVHDGLLIILNDGYKPISFDGFSNCIPVGVTEVPLTPQVFAMRAPGSKIRLKDGPFFWTHLWWPRDRPDSWPAKAKKTEIDGEIIDIDGSYSVVIQYVDQYGNRGKASAPSAPCYVTHEEHFDDPDRWVAKYLVTQWDYPLKDKHVTGVIVGRSGNMHADDDNNLTVSDYYAEYRQGGVAPCRFVHQHSDIVLKSFGTMDMSVGPPGAAYCGASWKRRLIVVSSEDRTIVRASEIGQHGEFRGVTYRTASPCCAVVPMGDRLCIVTRDSVEVMYEVETPEPRLARLEVVRKGSTWGRSFASLGSFMVGLFDDGFHIFSEQGFEKVDCPYWASGDFVDDDVRVMASIVSGEYYMLTCRLDGYGDDTNTILMLHLPSRKWYVIRDQVNDLAYGGPNLVLAATNDSIYEMFRGGGESAALHIDNWVPQGTSIDRFFTVGGARILVTPSSNKTSPVAISSVMDDVEETGLVSFVPNVQSVSGMSYPIWDGTTPYDSAPSWRDRDMWVPIRLANKISTSLVSVYFPIASGVNFSAMAIALEITDSGKAIEGSR